MIKSYKLRRNITNGIIYVILTALVIVWLLPLFWIVATSFHYNPKGIFDASQIIPHQWTFDNYIHIFTRTDVFNVPQAFLNTLIVAIFTCLLSTLCVLMISYTLSRLRFKSRKLIMNIGLILGMFPGFMAMIAIYHLLKVMGLSRTLVALVLVYSAGQCIVYFIAKGFFDTIPRALDEAATIDGATKNEIFWKIILPMSKPIIVYTVLTSFIAPWTDFLLAKIIMGDDIQNYTVAVLLWRMLSKENSEKFFLQFCASAVVIAIPITALFLKMQKFYVEGVTGGAVKG